MSKHHATPDAYYAAVPAAASQRVLALRDLISKAAPKAVPTMQSGVPAWNHADTHKPVVTINGHAHPKQCTVSPGVDAVTKFRIDVNKAGVVVSKKGDVLVVPHDKPVPAALLTKMLQWAYQHVGWDAPAPTVPGKRLGITSMTKTHGAGMQRKTTRPLKLRPTKRASVAAKRVAPAPGAKKRKIVTKAPVPRVAVKAGAKAAPRPPAGKKRVVKKPAVPRVAKPAAPRPSAGKKRASAAKGTAVVAKKAALPRFR